MLLIVVEGVGNGVVEQFVEHEVDRSPGWHSQILGLREIVESAVDPVDLFQSTSEDKIQDPNFGPLRLSEIRRRENRDIVGLLCFALETSYVRQHGVDGSLRTV